MITISTSRKFFFVCDIETTFRVKSLRVVRGKNYFLIILLMKGGFMERVTRLESKNVKMENAEEES
jgi:hypothetical protein